MLSIIITIICTGASFTVIITYLDNRRERRNKNLRTEIVSDATAASLILARTEITAAVNNLGAILTERLETKERVSEMRVDVAQIKAKVEFLASAQSSNGHGGHR
jgi:hypothetical protein